VVSTQIFTPCAVTPSANPMIRNGTWLNVTPSAPSTIPPTASVITIQARLPIRPDTVGVIRAAAP
jgi:hypothetical protein